MAIKGYFFNAVLQDGVYDRVYDAEDVTSYLDLLVSDGVFPNPSTNLQVMAGTGMQVSVQPGQGWIQGHKMINTAALPLTITAANALLARIDRVIFYVDYAAREMGIAVKTGTAAAANPTPPALVRTATRYEMCLATVTVNKAVTSITQASIQDTRGDSTVCGFVQGLVQQADTSTLFNQWNAAGAEQIANNQAVWDDWFNEVKAELAGSLTLQRLTASFEAAGSLTTFDVQTYIPSYGYATDFLDIYVSGLKLTESEYTLSGSSVTLLTPITHANTTVELVVWKQYTSA